MHHVGCMATLNHIGFRAEALNLAWFRANSVRAIHESPLLRASLTQILIFAFLGGTFPWTTSEIFW